MLDGSLFTSLSQFVAMSLETFKVSQRKSIWNFAQSLPLKGYTKYQKVTYLSVPL